MKLTASDSSAQVKKNSSKRFPNSAKLENQDFSPLIKISPTLLDSITLINLDCVLNVEI